MSAHTIYDCVSLGSVIRYSDGTPKPPALFRKKRSAWESRKGTVLKFLEDLSDEEIDSRMPAVRALSRRGRATRRIHRKQPPQAAKNTWEAPAMFPAGLGVRDRRRYRRTPPRARRTSPISCGPATRSLPPTAPAVS